MSSKQQILNALRNNTLEQHEMPSIDISPRLEQIEGQFAMSLKAAAARLYPNCNLTTLQQRIDALITEGKQVISNVSGIHANRESPIDPHDLKNIDYAVIQGDFGIAENGAIWINEKNISQRIVPFICENLFIVIKREAIVANMHQAVKQILKQDNGFGSFISGPSKTADIEQALVVGAHGARSLDVFFIN